MVVSPSILASSINAGSRKNETGMSTVCPGFRTCSVKQKHCTLLKYRPDLFGVTLNVAVPTIVSSLVLVDR